MTSKVSETAMISILRFRRRKGNEMILCENFYITFCAHSRVDVLIYCLNYVHVLVRKLLSTCTRYYFLFALLSIWIYLFLAWKSFTVSHFILFFCRCTFFSAYSICKIQACDLMGLRHDVVHWLESASPWLFFNKR